MPKAYYLRVLSDEFEIRCKRNGRYSLRAFARDLGLSAPRLSQIVSGKHGMSRAVSDRLAESLGLDGRDAENFWNSIECIHGRSAIQRNMAKRRLKDGPRAKFAPLPLDQFRVIADWYHFAILELTYLKSFKSDPRWIAAKLRITEAEANQAIERLLRMGLMKEEAGTLVAVDDHTATPLEVPAESIRLLHRQILLKALEALEAQAPEQRSFSSTFMAIDREKLPEAKKALADFRRKFGEGLNKQRKKDAVFCLSLQFFDLAPEARLS